MRINGRWGGRRGLYLAAFLTDLSMGTGSFAVPLLAIRLGASEMQLGLLGLAGGLYLLACLASGSLSDKWGRKRPAILACLIMATLYPLFGATGSFVALLALYCLCYTGMSLFWPPIMAWLPEQTDKRSLSSSVGILNISWSIGYGLAPMVGGFLAERSLRLPLFAATAGLLLVAGLLFLTKAGGRPMEEKTSPDPPRPLASTFLLMAWIGNFSLVFGMTLTSVLLPKVTTQMGISTAILGLVLASSGVARTAMFVVAGVFTRWQYRLWPLVAVQLGPAAGMLMVFWGGGAGVWAAGLALLGVGLGLTFYSSLLYSLEYSPARVGLRAGIHESVVGTSMFLGPLGGGLVADLTGNVKNAWLLAAAIPFLAALASLSLYYIGVARLKKSPPALPVNTD